MTVSAVTQFTTYMFAWLAQVSPIATPLTGATSSADTSPILLTFKDWTLYLASAIEAGAALVIAVAAIQAIILSGFIFFKPYSPPDSKEQVRLNLGKWLAVALEFELGADILRTAIAPTWSEIGQLAAIIILRTALNYFLQQEIDKAAQRQQAAAALSTAPALRPKPGPAPDPQSNARHGNTLAG